MNGYKRSIFIGDVFNTEMDATGQKIPADHPTDSLSLLPVFVGELLPPREFWWYFPDTRNDWGQRANAAIFDEKSGLKYIMFFNGDGDELYNIEADIGETSNLIEQQTERAQAMEKKLCNLLRSQHATLPPPVKA